MVKSVYILDCPQEYEFVVLAINSHSKMYKVCWFLNQIEDLNFEKTDDHEISKKRFFSRFKSEDREGNVFNLISNWSSKVYMMPHQKSINYFLIVNSSFWKIKKDELLSRIREIKNILLVFELDLEKEKYSDRFIIHDKKN